MNENLRKEVKLLKALQGITYKELAEYLEIKVTAKQNYFKYFKCRGGYQPPVLSMKYVLV